MIILRVLFVGVIVSCGCRKPESSANSALPPPAVTVARPLLFPVTQYHEYVGQTEAIESVAVRARVRGFISAIHFKEGAEVSKGDLLYEIEPQSFEADVRRSRAEVERLKAQVALTRSEEQRANNLRPTRAIAEEEYIQRVTARQQAEASLEQAQAALENANIELGYTKIHSPIKGRTSRTLVTVGNLVGYNEPTLLTTIVSIDPVYVFFDSPEKNVLDYQKRIREEGATSAIEQKLPVQLRLANESAFMHQGVVDFRESRVDPETGTMMIRGIVANRDKIISPGMFARVRIPLGKPMPQRLVPEVALSTDQRGDYVLVVKEDDVVEYRAVTIGQRIDEFVAITKGVTQDDLVIISGIQKARPGSKVVKTIKELTPPQPAASESGTSASNQSSENEKM